MIIIPSKILVKLLTFNAASAITIFPFIFLKEKTLTGNRVLINHEKIHIRQQLELLVLPFYFWYILEFFFKFIKYKSWNLAYLNISFEREAYLKQGDPKFLKNKKIWSFFKYL